MNKIRLRMLVVLTYFTDTIPEFAWETVIIIKSAR